MLAMLAAVAKMERDLNVERIQAGLTRAKAEGKTLGTPAKTTLEQRQAKVHGYANKQSVSELAKLHGVSRATFFTVVRPSGTKV
ncbi:recombinase family protein [Massilia sp. Leaf139]|uniref:recombinase family protein n=1 Tax=Massilia sp. Leaf139 TaxID=1736272 RepID=UPI0006F382E3|nr:hypothetical protein ASF77_10795 [Massilia sp. Leaf139]